MSSKSSSDISNGESESDYSEEAVDPRVQVELEKLNTATDEINKLEVDLDEARNRFRQLLCETTVQINLLGKKLGSCVEKARPYYDARIKAKEAFQETQKSAIRFERANSAHTAAKEMVFLAEEGLQAEGRTFDHAWQEMLNHATMRVNESERERTESEAEHLRTSKVYHLAEQRVQQLQKDLKRSISKSRPYFELKAQYNNQMEEQKHRVKRLENRVSQAKASYAEALRNLEQISDEIHKIRNNEIFGFTDPLGVRGLGVGAESPMQSSRDGTKTNAVHGSKKVAKMQPSTESAPPENGACSHSSGSGPGPPVVDSTEEYLKLPHKLSPAASPIIPKMTEEPPHLSQFLGLSSLANDTAAARMQAAAKLEEEVLQDAKTTRLEAERRPSLATCIPSCNSTPKKSLKNPFLPIVNSFLPNTVNGKANDNDGNHCWSAVNLADSSSDNSPSPAKNEGNDRKEVNGKAENDFPYHPLLDQGEEESNSLQAQFNNATPLQEEKLFCGRWDDQSDQNPPEEWTDVNLNDESDSCASSSLFKKVSFFNSNFSNCRSRNSLIDDSRRSSGELSTPPQSARGSVSLQSTPLKQRMKLDSSLVNWISRSNAAEENNSVIPNAVSRGRPSSVSRRTSLDTSLWNGSERVRDILSQGMMMLNISSLTERRASEPRSDKVPVRNAETGIATKTVAAGSDHPIVSKPVKKVPSPLEKSLTYLNAEDDSASDSESLHSMDMLTDDQISSLMMEQNLRDVCEDVLGTPISEVLPGYPTNST